MREIPVFELGSLLIESPSGESIADFTSFVTRLLHDIYGRVPEWLAFSAGPVLERNGRTFREFRCAAGSVDSQIQLRATKTGGIPRKLILRGSRGGAPYCVEITTGQEIPIDCREVKSAAA